MFNLLQKLPRSKSGFYCVAVLLQVSIAIVVGSAVKIVYTLSGNTRLPEASRNYDWAPVIGTALLSPVAETVALIVVCEVIKSIVYPTISMRHLVTTVGIIFGLLHGLNGLEKIVGPTFYFMTFSYAYLAFKPEGFVTGFFMSTLIHCTQNSLGLLAIWAFS